MADSVHTCSMHIIPIFRLNLYTNKTAEPPHKKCDGSFYVSCADYVLLINQHHEQ